MLAPTTPDQRMELSIYADITHIIRHGFIALDLFVGRVQVSLRSVLPWDRDLLLRRTIQGTDRQYKIWLLAQTTWMLDGHVLLGRQDVTIELYRIYSQLSSAHINKIFGAYQQIWLRYEKAFHGLESFGYEQHSRLLWIESKHVGVSSYAFRGYDSKLGISELQRSWIVYNDYEDRRLDHEEKWQTAKLIASASAPKGVDKLNAQDKSRIEGENSRRQSVQDTFYYKTKRLLSDSSDLSSSKGAKVSGAASPEELEDEMRKWILGEKDEHDIVVENYKRHVSQAFAKQMQIKEQQIMEARAVSRAADEDEGAVALVGYTLSQVREKLEDTGYTPHASTAHFQTKGRDYLYRRYLEKDPTTGTLSVDERGNIVANEEPKKMDDLISNRKIPFREGDS